MKRETTMIFLLLTEKEIVCEWSIYLRFCLDFRFFSYIIHLLYFRLSLFLYHSWLVYNIRTTLTAPDFSYFSFMFLLPPLSLSLEFSPSSNSDFILRPSYSLVPPSFPLSYTLNPSKSPNHFLSCLCPR